MAKKAKAPVLRRDNPTKAAQAAALLPAMFGLIPGLPAQIRDAAREQQRPVPFIPPKKRRGR